LLICFFLLSCFRWWGWWRRRGETRCSSRKDKSLWNKERSSHSLVAISEGAACFRTTKWFMHSMVGSEQRSFQDWRQCSSGTPLGNPQEPSSNELRQTVKVHPAILQEGNHEENGAISATGLPVLSSLRSLNPSPDELSNKPCC